jgi:hypothetical protein
MLNGYKTYIGAIIIGVSAALAEIPELASLAEPFRFFGLALLGIGLGHKLEKMKK